VTENDVPTVGEVWKRCGMKERVRVERIYAICACDRPVMHLPIEEHGNGSVDAINVQPLHGGSWWWTVMPEFLRRFERIGSSPPPTKLVE
jgi:hypothetical protein